MSTRTYSEKEAADLFRRAAEFQASRAHPETPGLTVDELRRAAAAAGIDPDALDYALAAPAPSSHEPTRFLGMATSISRRRFVPHVIDDDAWGRTVRDLREQIGSDGETETLGTIREWKYKPLRFTAEPVEGGTLLSADASWHTGLRNAVLINGGGLAFLLLGFLGAASALKTGGATGGFVIMGLLVALVGGLTLYGLIDSRTKAERLGAQVDAVFDSTAEHLANAPAALPEPTPQVDLDGISEPETGTASRSTARSRSGSG